MKFQNCALLLIVIGSVYITTALPSSSNNAIEQHDVTEDRESLKIDSSTVLASTVLFTSTVRTDNKLTDFQAVEDLSVELDENNFKKPQCWLCKIIVSKVVKHIKVKTTDAIMEELHHVCRKMKKLARKCNKFVDKHGHKIASLILKSRKPKNICSIIDLCSSKSGEQYFPLIQDRASVEITEIPQLNDNVEPQSCVLCELVIKKLADQVKDNKTAEEIKQEVENICKLMPKNLANSCDQFIAKNGDHIITMLQTIPPKQICQTISLCSENSLTEVKTSVTEGLPCMFCENVVGVVKSLLTADGTVRVIEHLVQNVCYILPGNLANICRSSIENFGNIIAQIARKIQPKDICATILICSENSLDEVKTLENEVATTLDEVETSENEDLPCVMCQNVIKAVEGLMKDNHTVVEIEHIVENICLMMPRSLAGNCKMFVERFGSLVVKYAQTIPPKEICQTILICSQKSLDEEEISENEGLPSFDEVEASENEDLPCVMCQNVVKALEGLMKDNHTVVEIEHIVENICLMMPQSLAGNCKMFVERFGSLVVKYAQTIPPKEICATILICSQNSLDTARTSEIEGLPCMMCENVLEVVHTMLNDNDLVQDMIHIAENVCNVLPFGGACKSLVDKYGNLIASLARSLPPKQICQLLLMCPRSDNQLNEQVIVL